MSNVLKLSAAGAGEFWEIPILFEDEHLLALCKPPLLLTSPDRLKPDQPSLTQLLHAGITQDRPWAKTRGLTYLMNAHRLDLETSGVLLLARSKLMLATLANLFGSEKPVNTCVVLVEGAPAEERFEINARIAPHPVRPGETCVDEKRGKQARTAVEVLERFSDHALLKCQLFTHRAHQVRVHLRRVQLPVVGDKLYGGRPLWLSRLKSTFRLKPGHTERPLIATPAVHAESLSLPHPITGVPLTITAPWPKDFSVGVKYLRRYAQAKLA